MVGDAKGGVSGGTIVSLVGAAFDETPEHRRAAMDPYGLLPPGAPRGPDKPDYWGALCALVLVLPRLRSAGLHAVRSSHGVLSQFVRGHMLGQELSLLAHGSQHCVLCLWTVAQRSRRYCESADEDVRHAGVGYSKLVGKWHAPFIMQIVNSRVVRRSNFFNHYGARPWQPPHATLRLRSSSSGCVGDHRGTEAVTHSAAAKLLGHRRRLQLPRGDGGVRPSHGCAGRAGAGPGLCGTALPARSHALPAAQAGRGAVQGDAGAPQLLHARAAHTSWCSTACLFGGQVKEQAAML